jgi:drug/metabolite transporter (DMT)-like permease
MSWIFLSVISALLLGFYDAAKKWSVRGNAVPVVLLLNVAIGALLYSPIVLLSQIAADRIPWQMFVVRPLSWDDHGLIVAKSILVGASWTFAFSALKHLPLSIAAPIRATSPFWTISVAILFFQERPTPLQWIGMGIILIGFWRFTLVGRLEGIRFTRDRSVYLMISATLLGACSSLYDKWLLQYADFHPVTMQAWFTIYLVPVMVPLAVWWYQNDRPAARQQTTRAAEASAGEDRRHVGNDSVQAFHWRWSIVLVSPLLITADLFYFIALSDDSAMISIVSVLRRCSVVIALAFGARALSEANFRAKLICVLIILAGVVLLTWQNNAP